MTFFSKETTALNRTNLRKLALEILHSGIERVLPENEMYNNISVSDGSISVFGEKHSFSGNLYVIGSGKAAAIMAGTFEDIAGVQKIREGYVNAPRSFPLKKIIVNEASIPIPNERGYRGAKKICEIAKNAKKGDIVVCLISGGGSVLMPHPVDGVSLLEKQQMTKLLFEAGVPTYSIQHVRKHVSKMKGGRLAKLIQPAKVIGLMVSDVVNPADVCAAGPTMPDDSTYDDAYDVLTKYGLLEDVPDSIISHIVRGKNRHEEETPDSQELFWSNVYNYDIVNNKMALDAMAGKARSFGFETLILPPVIGSTEFVTRMFARKIRDVRKRAKKYAIIASSEMAVALRGNGRGGRNQELAARLIGELSSDRTSVFASLDSDGQDYIKGIGGAIIDNQTARKAIFENISPGSFLDKSDSYYIHDKLGTLIRMESTGTNVGDIHIYLQE
ncbi:MAG: DUF4147 domain-containing protein [bacterium]|nr:DUF4147 domain-containing protein [bacterium]